MTVNKRTNIALIALGLVSAVAIGYFVWNYLAPPETVILPVSAPASDLPTGVLSEGKFTELHPYAELPIIPTNVGRPDPFMPFPIRGTNGNDNANASAAGGNVNLNLNAPATDADLNVNRNVNNP